ncbi:hypothetical protein YC2023_040907 [Brassica napus]
MSFLSLREEYMFEEMLVRIIGWSSKKVSLSRKFFFSIVRGFEDVSRYCKGLVLTLHWRSILVCLRMFTTKIVVPVWMLRSLIYDRGIRTKGSCRFVPGKKCFPSLFFVKSWHPEIYFLSDGAVVARMFWLGMKDVFRRIAEDVAGQGLDHGTFLLT